MIGEFMILAPRKSTYLDLVVESEKTPVPALPLAALFGKFMSVARWGDENLKGESEGTSAENEMSIVQFADVCGTRILLTGDAGVGSLTEAARKAFQIGILAPPDWFQVPHHGSRRNLSSRLLDIWLGDRLPSGPTPSPSGLAVISANQNDLQHPKKAVVRALIHRGQRVVQTKGILNLRSSSAPNRGWAMAVPLDYPVDQED